MELLSNVINSENLKDLYLKIMDDLSNILVRSYGPYGSNSLIQKGDNVFPTYTKDGHTILSNVKYVGRIERSITENILSITNYIVRTVGDGTTSAVLLSRNILDSLIQLQKDNLDKYPPVKIVETFKEVVKEINEKIQANGRDFTIEDAYQIAMISTNGDEYIAREIEQLYNALGNGVYIALNTTSQKQDTVSIYDGLVLETGLIEECYINDPVKKVSRIEHPQIYAFVDPVDTPEMIRFFDAILYENIFRPIGERLQILQEKNEKKAKAMEENLTPIVPTVIIAPKLSRDASQLMDKITQSMTQFNGGSVMQRPPVLVITNVESVDEDQYGDIISMCGCPPIKKYINPEVQKEDQEKGLAPTFENITGFYGMADVVECDHNKTSFIRPQEMFVKLKEGGAVLSEKYKALVAFLETELDKADQNKLDLRQIHHLKKRLNSLKASFVEWYVGGVSPSDRDQRSALIEDAIKNVRSAVTDGVGFGANFEGACASYELLKNCSKDSGLRYEIIRLIHNAYVDVCAKLYKYNYDDPIAQVIQMIKNRKPVNIVDSKIQVLSSIKTDQMILDGISNLVTIMATSNQYICPDTVDAVPYRADETVRKKREIQATKILNNKFGPLPDDWVDDSEEE